MDEIQMQNMKKLEATFQRDEIYTTYAQSAAALEAEFEAIADRLSPEEQKTVRGYVDCLKLQRLRAVTIAAEAMTFPEA